MAQRPLKVVAALRRRAAALLAEPVADRSGPDAAVPDSTRGPATAGTGILLGTGLDLVDLDRFRRVLQRRPSIAERLFTDDERAYAASRADPLPALAARFAAKEAAMKALGVGLGAFAWHDVEVRRLASSQPVLAVGGGAAELARSLGVRHWQLSLTHTQLVAGAVVMALG